MSVKPIIAFLSVSVFFATLPLSVGYAETEAETAEEPQTSSGIELPVNDPDYLDGHFETRLWPEGIVQAIEIEHLKFLATSPETPAEDRAMFLEIVNNFGTQQFNGPGF